ncbi:MAG: murein transglycosylase A, partial [Sphingomonadales bacterium]
PTGRLRDLYGSSSAILGIMARLRAAILAGVVVMAVGAGLWLALSGLPKGAREVDYKPVAFSDLDDWRGDHHAQARVAFLKSCAKLEGPADRRLAGGNGIAGTIADWRAVCSQARAVPAGDHDAARRFFETGFRPVKVTSDGHSEGLFTGYYEPQIAGSRTKKAGFDIPLYRRPADLITVDLGRFREDLSGRRIAGRAVEGSLRPYENRARIDQGALAGRGLELAWLDDPVAAFFLHIQGSGQILFEDGNKLRVGYAGHNGHPYTAIGRLLVARGELALDEVSMQSIKQWIATHPERAPALMAENASFIFFREIDGDGPIGSAGIVLTPRGSLAVDPRYIPLGVPVWLATEARHSGARAAQQSLRQLMVAQDTGGAIKGAVRGDIFFGSGSRAGRRAGDFNASGRIHLLLPVAVAERLRDSHQ